MADINTQDYRDAVQGEGPQAYNWEDKPHRLIFDLCAEIERRDRLLKQSVAIVKEHTGVLYNDKDYPLSILAQHAPLLVLEIERLQKLVENYRKHFDE